MLSNLPSQIQQEIEFIRPMVDERLAKMEEYGEDWDDKPVCRTIVSGISLSKQLVHRTICSCGFWTRPREWRGPPKAWHADCSQSILPLYIRRLWQVVTSRPPLWFIPDHSNSQTLTQVLYRLLANPEYIELLRQEADTVIAQEGWTKSGMDKMHKIDSFIREVQRIDGLSSGSLDFLFNTPSTS